MQYTKQGETIKYPKKKRQERRKDRGKQQYQANLGGNRGKETRKPEKILGVCKFLFFYKEFETSNCFKSMRAINLHPLP